MAEEVTIRINGREIRASTDQYVLNVAMDHGIFIPHYCWHPGLSPEGNCRMCLVKTNKSRKLEVACMTRCADGLEIDSEAPEVQEARKDVLEYLLINHPLDCPICDKSGECLLQNYTYTWRGGLSRFLGLQAKNLRPTKDLGPRIRFWGNRCIMCTRCVRFLREISGSGQLESVRRGDRNTIDTAPGIVLDDPLSLNTVDICPVGALINKDFLYQARAWYLKNTPSLCAHCSTGCNVQIQTLDGKIKRIVPRYNPEVNDYWMCDEGRLYYRYVHSDRRLKHRIGSAREAARILQTTAEQHGAGAIGALVSSYNTCEEIDLFKKIMDALGIETVGFLTRTIGKDRVFKSGFTIHADRTPNRAYLVRIFGEASVSRGVTPVAEPLAEGRLKTLFVLNGVPDFRPTHEIRDHLDGLQVIVLDILQNRLTDRANVLLPGCTWAEKTGTFVNAGGIEQKIRPAVEPPGDAVPETRTLNEILLTLKPAPVPAK